jgi:hypothetical protein
MPPVRKIFLESNVLFQLGPRLENADLSRLLSVKESVPIEILVAEVSWKEYLRDRKSEVGRCLERFRPITSELGNHGVRLAELNRAEKALEAYLARLEEHFGTKAMDRGFQIVPMPNNIDVRRLLEMSIDCVPPFEGRDAKSKEKGFRDSLIMFTVLENTRDSSGMETILVTGDILLEEGISLHQQEFNTTIRVYADIASAVDFLETGLDEEKRGRILASSEEARLVLEQFRDQMVAKVSEIRELSDSDLGQGGPFITPKPGEIPQFSFLAKNLNEYVDIQKVLSASFEKLVTVVWKQKLENKGTILFMIQCVAKVLARAPYLGTYMTKKNYVIGGATPLGFGMFTAPTEEKDLQFYLYGEAQIQRSDGDQWKLNSLRLDKSLDSEEEYNALSEADLASLS